MEYNFNPALAFAKITTQWIDYAEKTKANKWVVGVSGGKDSAVVAALAVEIFGADNVELVMMPNGTMKSEDIAAVEELVELLGIDEYNDIDISKSYHSILNNIKENGIELSEDTKINLAPRLRMSTLYALSQSIGGRPVNTSNLSERMLGYSTLWGDNCGAFAPIADLTTTEVIELGKWLGLSDNLINKIPEDGLSGKSDEEKLGIKYSELDKFIRIGEYDSEFMRRRYYELFNGSKFKRDMINVPMAKMPWNNEFITNAGQKERMNKIILG